MSLSDLPSPPEPAGDAASSAARRRRRRRYSLPVNAEERAEFLTELVERVTPAFDFYLFSLLSGLALAIAIMTDTRAFFVLAALMAPFMAPVVGIAFASVLGSGRFLVQMLGATGLGGLIIFGWGAVTGWLARFWQDLTFTQAGFHAQISWADLLVLVLGAAVTVYALVRAPQQRPLVSSVALAYELYLPLGVAGFGLTNGQAELWAEGLVVFAVHLFLAVLTGMLTLAALRLRPLNAVAYAFSALLAAAALGALLLASLALHPPAVPGAAAGAAIVESPTAAGLVEPGAATAAPVQHSATPPVTVTAVRTRTPTNTLVPTRVPSATITPVPTPLWAYINASQGGGALIRREPSFNAPLVISLINGNLVQVLPEMVEAEGVTWVKIRMDDGREGWIVRSLLVTATPSPGW